MSDAKLSFVDELKAALHKLDPNETEDSFWIYRALLTRIDALEAAARDMLTIIEISGVYRKRDIDALRSTVLRPDFASRAHLRETKN